MGKGREGKRKSHWDVFAVCIRWMGKSLIDRMQKKEREEDTDQLVNGRLKIHFYEERRKNKQTQNQVRFV